MNADSVNSEELRDKLRERNLEKETKREIALEEYFLQLVWSCHHSKFGEEFRLLTNTDTKLQPENKINVFELSNLYERNGALMCEAQYFQEGQAEELCRFKKKSDVFIFLNFFLFAYSFQSCCLRLCYKQNGNWRDSFDVMHILLAPQEWRWKGYIFWMPHLSTVL